MEVIHRITLDVKRSGVQAQLMMRQGDTNTQKIVATLRSGTVPLKIESGITSALYGKKPDNTELFNACTSYTTDSVYPDTIVYTVTADTVSAAGSVICTLCILSANGATLYSPQFAITVSENTFLNNTITSSSEYTALLQAKTDALAAQAAAELAQTAAEAAAESAANDMEATLEASFGTMIDGKVTAHNASNAAHSDIRALAAGKVSKTDIKDNLTSTDTDKPLSAKQGKVLSDKIGAETITVGTTSYSKTDNNTTLPAYPETLPASDVSAWAKAETKPAYTASEVGAIPMADKGSASGVAELDENGKVLSSQLPSYVDDVIESTYADFPATGESGKIYIDSETNKSYRWSGTGYAEIASTISFGETSSTAYRGDRGKTAYNHSLITSGNPHGVTKANVGLGNADNTSDLDKPVSTATQTALSGKISKTDIRDNLTSTDTDKPLSAKQGKVLSDKIGAETITVGTTPYSKTNNNTTLPAYPTTLPASDVSAWAKSETKPAYTASEVGAIPTADKGSASGVAELDENGKVPTSQLPSYVDDVIVGTFEDFGSVGEFGKIYYDTESSKMYRWAGPQAWYVEICPSLALGETSGSAYRGDRGKTAYNHSLITSGNPHGVTKANVGLGNADNTSDLDKPVSTATQAALDGVTASTQTLINTVKTEMPRLSVANESASGRTLVLDNTPGTLLRGTDYGYILKHKRYYNGSYYPEGFNQLADCSEFHSVTLDDSAWYHSHTFRGIAYTCNYGVITANGTATGGTSYVEIIAATLTPGHKYMLKGMPLGTVGKMTIDGGCDYGQGTVFTASANEDGEILTIEIEYQNGVSPSNETIKPQLVDLTVLYGAGHEMSTVAAVLADYPEYNSIHGYITPATLLTKTIVPVGNKVRIYKQGKNLLDIDALFADVSGICGLAKSQNVNGTYNLRGTTVSTSSSGYLDDGGLTECAVPGNQMLTATVYYDTNYDIGTSGLKLAFYDDTCTVVIKELSDIQKNTPYTFMLPSGASYVRLMLKYTSGQGNVYTEINNIKIMIKCGAEASAWEPYSAPVTVEQSLTATDATQQHYIDEAVSIGDTVSERIGNNIVVRTGRRTHTSGDDVLSGVLTDGTYTYYKLDSPFAIPIQPIADIETVTGGTMLTTVAFTDSESIKHAPVTLDMTSYIAANLSNKTYAFLKDKNSRMIIPYAEAEMIYVPGKSKYLDSVLDDIIAAVPEAGPPGANGTDGADGRSIYAGTVLPDTAGHVEGDIFILTTNGELYQFNTEPVERWADTNSSVKGPKGDTGAQGQKGEKGDTGAQGQKGEKGDKGDVGNTGASGTNGTNGTTFTPAVSSAGVISWTNDGGKSNPGSVDLVAAVLAALPTYNGGTV